MFEKQIPSSCKGPLKSTKFGPGQIVGISGQQLETLGVAKLTFKIGPTEWQVPFEIIRGMTSKVLLGSDFLALSKAQLDFDQRTLKLGDHIGILHRKSE